MIRRSASSFKLSIMVFIRTERSSPAGFCVLPAPGRIFSVRSRQSVSASSQSICPFSTAAIPRSFRPISPIHFITEGFRRSPSSSTTRYFFFANASARFTATVVFPSPDTALVTRRTGQSLFPIILSSVLVRISCTASLKASGTFGLQMVMVCSFTLLLFLIFACGRFPRNAAFVSFLISSAQWMVFLVLT